MFQSVTPRPGKIAFQVDPFPVPTWEELAPEAAADDESAPRVVGQLELLAHPSEAAVPDIKKQEATVSFEAVESIPAAEVVHTEAVAAVEPEFILSPLAEAVSAALEDEPSSLDAEIVSVPPTITAWIPPKKTATAGSKRGGKNKRFGTFFGQ